MPIRPINLFETTSQSYDIQRLKSIGRLSDEAKTRFEKSPHNSDPAIAWFVDNIQKQMANQFEAIVKINDLSQQVAETIDDFLRATPWGWQRTIDGYRVWK